MITQPRTYKLQISIAFLLFFVLYSLVSLVNHYLFRTYAFDLGIFNQAAYDYSRFEINDNTVLAPHLKNLLSDHMCLILIPLSPIRYLFGSYSLLIVQILAILFGALGSYKFFLKKHGNHSFAYMAMIHFLSIWAIFGALSFDYHNNVVGVMMIPWFFYYLLDNKLLKASFFALLLIISKENMALYMGFIALGLLITLRTNFKKRVFLFSLSVFSILYFLVVVEVIIPAIAEAGREYGHFNYEVLGKNFGEAVVTLFQEPLHLLKSLFINHSYHPIGDNVKAEFYITFLLSGGFAVVYYPRYLIMFLIIIAQKMFNNDYAKWSVLFQYSVELVPIINIALFELLSTIKQRKLKIASSITMIVLTFMTTLYIVKNNKAYWVEYAQVCFYDALHFKTNFNVEKLHELIREVPEDAAVSAESNIVPHLAMRDKIYTFPVVEDANYLFLLPNDGRNYPHSQEVMEIELSKIKKSKEWNTVYKDDVILVLKRSAKQ